MPTLESTKICKQCKETKQLDAFYPHSGCIGGYRPECRKCTIDNQRPYQQSKKEQLREYNKQYREKNQDKLNKQHAEYYKNHSEEIKVNVARWKKQNPEQVKINHKKYRNRHLAKERARASKLKKERKNRVPKWLTELQWQEIEQFYQDCIYLEALTKQKFHVDHIIPLNGKIISGLHVPWNLQILSAEENLKKGRKF